MVTKPLVSFLLISLSSVPTSATLARLGIHQPWPPYTAVLQIARLSGPRVPRERMASDNKSYRHSVVREQGGGLGAQVQLDIGGYGDTIETIYRKGIISVTVRKHPQRWSDGGP